MKKNVWPEWNDQCLNYTYYMFSTNNYKFPPNLATKLTSSSFLHVSIVEQSLFFFPFLHT